MSFRPYTTGTPEWHALRAKHVGASEVAALFGVQPDYAPSHYALWHIKAGLVPSPEVDNPRVHWGNRLEAVIAEGAAAQEGWPLRKGGYAEDDTCPGLGASLDYEALPTADDEAEGYTGTGALECKNSDWLVHRRSWTDGEPPLHILLQLQAQLAASGYAWGAVACLVGGNDLRVYRYRAKPKLIADIRRRVAVFWQSIAEGKPPRVDGSDSAADTLRALYPEPVYEIADLTTDNELPEICAGYLNACAERKAAKAREDEFRNRLLAKMGAHQAACMQGFFVRLAITAAKPDRPALPGEIIHGRAESRRLHVKESTV